MHKPPVTILMSEYNTDPKQFHECMESILSQDYKDYELIIIDDCGKNNVEKLLERYNDRRIRLIKNKHNIKLAKSLNRGIKEASGKYILRMDTDDIMLPNRIKTQVNFIEKHPQYSLVGGRSILFDGKKEYGTTGKEREPQKNDFLFGPPFAHPTLIIKKEALEKIGGYPCAERCEDYAMEMEMYLNGYKGYVMDDILIKYRQDANGYKKKQYKYRIEEFKIRKKYFKQLKLPAKRYIYMIKPLVVGLIPGKILYYYHNKTKKRNNGYKKK